MKLLLFALAALLIPMGAWAYNSGQAQNVNYGPTLGELIEYGQHNGEHVHRFIHSFYDVTVNGGTTVGTYNLTMNRRGGPLLQIPANSLIKQTYLYVKTQFTGIGGSTTFALACGNATLLSATNLGTSLAGAVVAGNQTGTAANMSDVGTSSCTPTATIANQGYATGQVDIYIDFVSHN
jgi:hypothetical protein